jgi:hypothetical protein
MASGTLCSVTTESEMTYDRVFSDLSAVYLEDSWVLEVSATGRAIQFVLDGVLTPEHPQYRRPNPGEQYCYRRAVLDLASDDPIEFMPRHAPPAVDATGEPDYGHVDAFEGIDRDGNPAWKLSGDWGFVIIVEPMVTLTFVAE